MPMAGVTNATDVRDSGKQSADAPAVAADASVPDKATEKDARLPVTVLSGFLGAGKTSLLMHILKNKAGLRCAILVNDMAELNVDANLVRDGGVVQVEEELVQMQNGCICCTLRADLVVEVAKLTRQNRFDYLIIESTGISEPMQVAETFTMPVPIDMVMESVGAKDGEGKPEENGDSKPSDVVDSKPSDAGDSEPSDEDPNEALGALASLARLDTCVTVIDAANFDQTMSSVVTVKEGEYSRVRRGENGEAQGNGAEIPDEDDRTLVNLMVDQIEFADVIILNKTDIALPSQVKYIKAFVKMLNPNAELLTSVNSVVPLSKVIGTGRFDMDKAAEMESWQRDVADIEAGVTPKPETEEYGVGSFVFRAARPFHPERFYKFVDEHFLMTVEYQDAEVEFVEGDDAQAPEEDSHKGHNHSKVKKVVGGADREKKTDTDAEGIEEDAKSDDAEADGNDGEDGDEEEESDDEAAMLIGVAERQEQQAAMKKLSKSDFGGDLLRSKGFCWVASSRYFPCLWSQAGSFLTLAREKPWYSELAGYEPPAEDKEYAKGSGDKEANGDPETSPPPPCGREKDYYAMDGLDPEFLLGDKRTEVVLIGHEVDKDRLRKCLEACLLTNEEIARLGAPVRDRAGWSDLKDPFGFPVLAGAPTFDDGEEDGDDDDDSNDGENSGEDEGEAEAAKNRKSGGESNKRVSDEVEGSQNEGVSASKKSKTARG